MKLLVLILTFYSDSIAADRRDTILASNRRDTVCLESMTVKEFKDKLAVFESGGLKEPYQAVNQYGYLGKYQISKRYLEKYGRVSREVFLRRGHIQEITMNRLIAHYLNAIHRLGLDRYLGLEIRGIRVTLEGLLAGYHQHPLALKKWLESCGEVDMTDGNGTPVSKYIRL